MILEKHYLRTVHEWTKSYIELIALYVHPKNSNHLRSHLRAIMSLDHSRLGLENKFWENKSGRIFCVWLVYFTKSCQQIWGACKPTFYTFLNQIWSETVLWGAAFIVQTSDKMQYFTVLQYKLHSFHTQDDRSTHARAFNETVKFPKSPIRPAGSHFWQARYLQCELRKSVWININRATLQRNKEVIMYIQFLF